jgi:hypothetical protein
MKIGYTHIFKILYHNPAVKSTDSGGGVGYVPSSQQRGDEAYQTGIVLWGRKIYLQILWL